MIRGLGWSCLLWLALAQLAAAIEPWADERLAVRDGVAVWLDGAAQGKARTSLGEPALVDEAAVEVWHDASGQRRDAKQADELLRPVWRVTDASTTVRLSGRGPYLTVDNLGLSLQEATVFIVAAPFHNEGEFRGLLSLHGKEKADFVSGLNIDQGFAATPDFGAINVEGAGAGGQQNLRTAKGEFRAWQRICVESRVGEQGIRLFVDGRPEGTRKRDESAIEADRLIVGGRFTGGIEGVRYLFAGEIAEVIIYDRRLSDDERAKVDAYLAAKYAHLPPVPPPADIPGMRRVKLVDSPPPVQMFVPGFKVRELPVKLTNINNVLYREDGALVALAYDGNVYLLRDTDGDGVEDGAEVYWKNEGQLRAPIGMALTPPGYERGRGVFVACRGKIVLLLDKDQDNVAEEEVVVATGWPELFVQVDALGVAVDPDDHSIYFGIGTENFTNGHLVDENGVAKYTLDNEHGTILRVAPDFKSREIVATGIRFPVAMRFNKDGDLFCTDQEGATWLPNGNPFDELLHIKRGRHYGFPPRHPRHLPNVIDEPSVFDYRPQHQCATGLNFNEPATDGTIFGPEWWQSDALVTGYSRGKLYRTKLAQTSAGYVGQNQIIGATNMLPADACVAPDRSLVIAVHSGGPDWGSGPSGEGKLYKVTYEDRDDAPIPSLIWAESPREARIAFDRPIDPAMLKDLAKRISIDGGEFVGAGDRFESFRPGYAVVERQMNSPRFGVEVQGVQLTADRRTLIVTTAPQTLAVNYGVSLPGIVQSADTEGPTQTATLPQYPDVELQYDLAGVEAIWEPANGETLRLWLPHLDLDVSKELTRGSATHDQFWEAIAQGGTLTLRTRVDLRDLLRPAVQPGAKLDYEWPPEKVELGISATGAMPGPFVTVDGKASSIVRGGGPAPDEHRMQATWISLTPDWHAVEVKMTVVQGVMPDAGIRATTDEGPNDQRRMRPLALRRFLLPWAEQSTRPTELVDNRDLPELNGGSWLRGQQEFFGTTANCSKCHTMRGVGGKIGPDLSNLPQRDYASVLRDVTQPSFAINPDFTSQVILLADGRTLAGTTRVDGDNLIVADQEGKETSVPRAEVEELTHSPQSIMPEGLPKALGEERLRDLMTFLLLEPPHMPVYGELPPPPPRRMADVEAVLAGAQKVESPRPLRVMLVSGPKDHGAGEHDYPAWLVMWRQLLEMAEGVTVDTAETWPTAEQFNAADAVVFFQKGDWTPERARDLDAFLARGGGASYIHYAVDGGNDAPGFAERIGLAWMGGRSKFRHGPLDVDFTAGKNHPVGRNFDKVHFYDESYWQPYGDPGRINLLATCIEEGAEQPLFWTREHNGGRVFVSIPGHYSWTFDDPLFRVLLLRGLAWTAREPVDRFNDLVLPGARVRQPAAPPK
jgi:putative heme-binding domain-containing protein